MTRDDLLGLIFTVLVVICFAACMVFLIERDNYKEKLFYPEKKRKEYTISWIEHDVEGVTEYICPNCWEIYADEWNYCPSCGLRAEK